MLHPHNPQTYPHPDKVIFPKKYAFSTVFTTILFAIDWNGKNEGNHA
jgi:hypothetical protein